MSSFILLWTNVNLCHAASIPASPLRHPPHLHQPPHSLPRFYFVFASITSSKFIPPPLTTQTFPSSVSIPLTLLCATHCIPPPPAQILHISPPHLPFLFYCLFFFFFSLLGDPLVTSSLRQLPWFRRERERNTFKNETRQALWCCITQN